MRLIYAFVNGSKSLYGPEKIARKYLKGPKSKGGIAGIDVKIFVCTIVLKHFSKAMKNREEFFFICVCGECWET